MLPRNPCMVLTLVTWGWGWEQGGISWYMPQT